MLELRLRQLEPDDDVSDFRIGGAQYEPLRKFLAEKAKNFHKRNLARTWVFVATRRRVVAYVTLVCGEVELSGSDRSFAYRSYPAVKIARLAVDERFRGHQLGKMLVDLALGIARREISPRVGCRVVTVDAKADAVTFYQKQGFNFIETEKNKQRPEPVLFVDLNKSLAKVDLVD